MAAPVIFGCAGPALLPDERGLFAELAPVGLILFARNCIEPSQVIDLVSSFLEAAGRPDAAVLIDQEGGRVARLGPPHWRRPPAAGRLARLYDLDPDAGLEATRLNARLIAHELLALGIDVDCTPVLDVPVPDAHDIIGDRAYGTVPEPIIALGRQVCDGLMQGGVAPVIKHIPGHGRARADSHVELPVVEASYEDLSATDFVPFRAFAGMPWAMTAHVVYTAVDRDRPATTSPAVIDKVIRRDLGFEGALMSDDLGMSALSGGFAERARASLAAGCDVVLHCSGRLDEMIEVQKGLSPMTAAAADRVARARIPAPTAPFDAAAATERLDRLLARVPS
jgi:beta-N-acetylhexosaminidase